MCYNFTNVNGELFETLFGDNKVKQRISVPEYLGRFSWTRHFETEYKGVFPDITPKGEQTGERLAREIEEQMDGELLMLIASPAARAQGSADLLKRKLRIPDKVIIEPRIREAVVYAVEGGAAIYRQLVAQGEAIRPGFGQDYLSICYATDIRYDDERIIEPRSKVRGRFYDYFAGAIDTLLRQLGTGEFIHFVHVSHYEVLYHFVERIFGLDYEKGDRPLLHGELIVTKVFATPKQHVVELEVKFRGMNRLVRFNRTAKKISAVV